MNKIGVAATCVGATLLPILMLSKRQGHMVDAKVFKNMNLKDKGKAILKSLNVDYGLKEMLIVGGTSILGGVTGGVIFDKKTDPRLKIQEGINKFSVLAIPAGLVSLGMAISKKAKIKNPIGSIASVVLGVGLGMPLANKVSNKINEKAFGKDCFEKRKIKPTDYLVHIDDLVGAMVLSKVPLVNSLQLDKVLGVIYAHQAYEAGSHQGEKKI